MVCFGFIATYNSRSFFICEVFETCARGSELSGIVGIYCRELMFQSLPSATGDAAFIAQQAIVFNPLNYVGLGRRRQLG